MAKTRGGKRRVNYNKLERVTKLKISWSRPKFFLFLPFERCYMIFTETHNIVAQRGVQRACFFKLLGPLTLGGARAPPSVKWSGGQDCWGKARGIVEHCRTLQILKREVSEHSAGRTKIINLPGELGWISQNLPLSPWAVLSGIRSLGRFLLNHPCSADHRIIPIRA